MPFYDKVLDSMVHLLDSETEEKRLGCLNLTPSQLKEVRIFAKLLTHFEGINSKYEIDFPEKVKKYDSCNTSLGVMKEPKVCLLTIEPLKNPRKSIDTYYIKHNTFPYVTYINKEKTQEENLYILELEFAYLDFEKVITNFTKEETPEFVKGLLDCWEAAVTYKEPAVQAEPVPNTPAPDEKKKNKEKDKVQSKL